MALIRKMVALGTAVVLATMMFGALSTAVHAQTPPFTAYGTGQKAGSVVTAWIGTKQCASATVDASGNWLLYVDSSCPAVEGDKIAFQIDGKATNETATYTAGGAPADVAKGITLTLAAGGGATATATTPAPSKTGNAGLLGSTGTSMALVLALGVFAAAMVAGGRTATRRS